jgi:hypothetical protein
MDDCGNTRHALRADTPRLGLWLDTSDLSLAASVEQVLARMAEAIID